MLIAQIIALLVGGSPALALEEAEVILAAWPPGYDDFLQAGVPGSLSTDVEGRLRWPSAAQPIVAPQHRDAAACTHSLFEQPWWLDAVAPGNWDAATVTSDGEIIGRLPYVRMRRCGLTILGQPPLTQFLGPWMPAPLTNGWSARTRSSACSSAGCPGMTCSSRISTTR
jgi:hypothetical protein